MQLGADGVFVCSGIFKSGDPDLRAKAIVEATTHFQDAKILAEVSTGLGEPMVGISSASLADSERLEARGWERAPGRRVCLQADARVWSGRNGDVRLKADIGHTFRMTIGVLALQGAFREHIAML